MNDIGLGQASGLSNSTSTSAGINSSSNVNNQLLLKAQNAMTKSLLDLVPGETFKGEILNIKQDSVTIQIGNQIIEGKLEQNVALSIHDTINFVVKENADNKIMIAPVLDGALQGMDTALYQALEQAGLAATDKNIDTIMELLKNQMPLDKTTIQKMLMASYQHPDINIEDLALMLKNNIPITKDTIEQWQNYKDSNHQITNQLKEMSQQLPELIQHIVSTEEKGTSYEILKDIFKNPIFDEIRNELDNLLSAFKKENIGKDDILNFLTNKQVSEDGEPKNLLNKVADTFLHQLSVKPEEFNREAISKHFEQIEKQMNFLLDKTELFAKNKPDLLNSAKDVKSNLEFIKELNQNFIYTQLPIKLSKQVTHSDLYVFSNRNLKKSSKDSIKLLLHLDMEYLGSTDIMVVLQEKKLNLEFTFTEQEALQITGSHLGELEERLEKKGFQVTSSLSVKEQEEAIEFVEDFIKQSTKEDNLTRYSFDMRA